MRIYYESRHMARSIGFKFTPYKRSYRAVTGKTAGCGAWSCPKNEPGLQQLVSSFAKSFSISGICRKWAKVSFNIADATPSRGARRR